MQDAQNARQQIVERIRQSTSILVAVGNNPSVDALAAAIGLSLMLNKMNKHTTAVFSGQAPQAIQFLEPNKTFESNVDALRDFIISLDKEKADRLRYKVEDDVVRIFITPYKTSITEKDLQYSQGDFNVDLIMALGVEKREDLDKAIVSHGRILHDATVITVNANGQHSSLGAIDWNDPAASSLCEMLVSASEGFQQPGLLDAQISTALLTGIVAATDRFSNTQTSPRVMTMAAQLMAAGANQQLIAINLAKPSDTTATGGTLAKQIPSAIPAPIQEEKPKPKDGELDITHPKPEKSRNEQLPPKKRDEASIKAAEDELAAALPSVAAANTAVADLKSQLEDETKRKQEAEDEADAGPRTPGSESVNTQATTDPKQDEDYISSHGSWKAKRLEPPTLGGTLSATSEEALKEEQESQDEDRNKKILTHPGDAPASPAETLPPATEPMPALAPVVAPPEEPAVVAAPEPVTAAPPPTIEEINAPLPPMPSMINVPDPSNKPAADAPQPMTAPVLDAAPAPDIEALHKEIAEAAQPAAEVAGDVHSARAAVSEAFAAPPADANSPVLAMPANVPVSEPLTPEALQALSPAPAAPIASNPVPPAMSPTDLPPMPPMPTSETALPPAPDLPGLNQPLPPITEAPAPEVPPTPPAPADPGQFKIPGS